MKTEGFKGYIFLGLIAFILLGLVFTTFASAAGLKKLVAVSKFENKTSIAGGGLFDLDNGLADQLTDALVQSGQFVVLERETLGDVIQEQDMAASGRFQKSKTARTGKLTNAQILIKGTVTEFESSASKSNSGINISGFSIGGKSASAHIGLIIRLIDTTTGEVLDSQRVEGNAKAGGLNLGVNYGNVNFGSKSFKATPLGKATQITIDKAVKYISSRLKNLPYQGRVVKVSEDVIYVSAGKKVGTSEGDVFSVYARGEELIDPDTGEILGSDEEKVGQIKIFSVQEKFSKARAVGDLEGIKAGNIIRYN